MKHHRAGIIFWIVIASFTAVHGYQLGLGQLRHPGPGFIFFSAGSLLLVLGLIDLIRTFIIPRGEHYGKEEPPIWKGVRWEKVVFVFLCLSAYGYFFESLGFLLSTLVLMFLLFKGVEPTTWRFTIASTIITVLLSHLIFKVWLKVQFPKGFIGF